MEGPAMLWKAFERSGSPEIYLQYRQAADRLPLVNERKDYVYQDRSDRAPRGGVQRRG